VLGVIALAAALAGCGESPEAQNKECAQAVDALSANLEAIRAYGQIDVIVARNVTTVCPSRAIWRISAKVDHIPDKLAGLPGVDGSAMRGTSSVALNSALFMLCGDYGPDDGSPACTDNG
jgi:hypothetical protein